MPPHLSNGSKARLDLKFFFSFSLPFASFFFFFKRLTKIQTVSAKNLHGGGGGSERAPHLASVRGELDDSCDCPAGTQSLRFGWRFVCLTPWQINTEMGFSLVNCWDDARDWGHHRKQGLLVPEAWWFLGAPTRRLGHRFPWVPCFSWAGGSQHTNQPPAAE